MTGRSLGTYKRPEATERTAAPKKPKGSTLIDRRQRGLDRVAAEQKVMQAALRRDNRKCRNPRCGFKKSLKLPVDPCHAFRHRGSGGNPAGDRTAATKQIVSLCRGCHGMLDSSELEIEPLTVDWCDGPCAFYARHLETGIRTHIATERLIGVSATRDGR